MSMAEQALLHEQFSKTRTYLEFGMGGSTLAAARRGLSTTSVESNKEWISKVLVDIASKIDAAAIRITALFADIGPIKEWGIPASQDFRHQWPNYYLAIWGRVQEIPDFILIDGRFRTACFICAALAVPSTTRIAIHDFRDGDAVRSSYEKVLEFAVIEKSVETLYIFRPKADLDKMRALSVLRDVMEDYS